MIIIARPATGFNLKKLYCQMFERSGKFELARCMLERPPVWWISQVCTKKQAPNSPFTPGAVDCQAAQVASSTAGSSHLLIPSWPSWCSLLDPVSLYCLFSGLVWDWHAACKSRKGEFDPAFLYKVVISAEFALPRIDQKRCEENTKT
jgi:hypothetical protein